MPPGRTNTLNPEANMTRLTSTRIPHTHHTHHTHRVAALFGAAIALLLALPTTARAEDCTANYAQCLMERTMNTDCVNDYLDCTRGVIRWY
jgi:hypothetical protein